MKYKDFVDTCALGRLNQGLIFNGARAEDYDGCLVYGVMITARCDIAHGKTRTFNYLPIVRLHDWWLHDGRLIFCNRATAEISAGMASALEQAGFSKEVLKTESPDTLLTTLFEPSKERRVVKARPAFEQWLERHKQLELAAGDNADKALVLRLMADGFPRIRDAVLRELCAHQLTGYYFFPQIDPVGSDDGYVVLLRETRHMPRELAHRIADGMSKEEYELIATKNSALFGRLSFADTEFVMPMSQVVSPRLEHVLQNFSLLFGRIGVTDISTQYRAAIWKRIFPGEDQ